MCVSRDSFMYVAWLVQMCDLTYSYVWHDNCMCVRHNAFTRVCSKCDTLFSASHVSASGIWCVCDTTPSCVCDVTRACMWHDSFKCVPWLIQMCGMTDSYVCHNAFTSVCSEGDTLCCASHVNASTIWCVCVIRLVHVCDVTRSYVCRDSFMCVIWLVHVCDVNDSYVWRDAFTRASSKCDTLFCASHVSTSHIWSVCGITHQHVWYNTFMSVIWLVHKHVFAVQHVVLRRLR